MQDSFSINLKIFVGKREHEIIESFVLITIMSRLLKRLFASLDERSIRNAKILKLILQVPGHVIAVAHLTLIAKI